MTSPLLVQYADDTQVLVSGRPGDIGFLVASMERTLLELSLWFGMNGLKINAGKTQLIVLGFGKISNGFRSVCQCQIHGCHCRRFSHCTEPGCRVFFFKFSPNLLNGLICEAGTRAKQSLLRRSRPLQSDREIPDNRQDLETKV